MHRIGWHLDVNSLHQFFVKFHNASPLEELIKNGSVWFLQGLEQLMRVALLSTCATSSMWNPPENISFPAMLLRWRPLWVPFVFLVARDLSVSNFSNTSSRREHLLLGEEDGKFVDVEEDYAIDVDDICQLV